MLTVDFALLDGAPGQWLLDLGCGGGRHTFEALRRGFNVAAVDLDGAALAEVSRMVGAMRLQDEVPPGASSLCLEGDALVLPFPDRTFERVIASELLEHIDEDAAAISEVSRVMKPGAMVAITVPRWWPERVCWSLSRDYHGAEGRHVRIYRRRALRERLGRAGLRPVASHHAHALHSPYWWLRCAFGVDNERAAVPALYHRFLVWDITARPRSIRALERALDPVLGKSLVIYAVKPSGQARAA